MSDSRTTQHDIGLLILRLGASAFLLYGHGWPKLAHFSERAAEFANPIGIGSVPSFALVVFAEVACAVLVALGFFTRLAVVPLLIFFAVAIFIQHASDPFKAKELAFVYAVPYLTLWFTGAGRFSLDARLGRGR